jgi:hypothetical protein
MLIMEFTPSNSPIPATLIHSTRNNISKPTENYQHRPTENPLTLNCGKPPLHQMHSSLTNKSNGDDNNNNTNNNNHNNNNNSFPTHPFEQSRGLIDTLRQNNSVQNSSSSSTRSG